MLWTGSRQNNANRQDPEKGDFKDHIGFQYLPHPCARIFLISSKLCTMAAWPWSKTKIEMWWLIGSARPRRGQRSRVRIRYLPQWSWGAAGSLCNTVRSQGRWANLHLRPKKYTKKFPQVKGTLLYFLNAIFQQKNSHLKGAFSIFKDVRCNYLINCIVLTRKKV